ncbi:MAG: hypothetical protein JW940_39365 [Polyangiaceae bacterium]|nr:hypothetical protein [Polyangiaceae bacterium]
MRVYEINTVPWLADLTERHGSPIDLASVPDGEWDALVPFHFDAVWLMGVWRRSPAAAAIARATEGVIGDCAKVCPGFEPMRDVIGSPYAIQAYVADARVGGPAALAAAREKLKARGMRLFLDFVPNHTAPDHAWLTPHPKYYVRGASADAEQMPGRFCRIDGAVVAFGAPSANPAEAWRDTCQLDAFSPAFRSAAVDTLIAMGEQCDGVRCDMAMLALDDAFEALWGRWAGPRAAQPFWREVIDRVRLKHPRMTFIAESYWNSEWALQQQGFDFCYDKDLLYDRLAHGSAESLRQHLAGAPLAFQEKLIHFCENHDDGPMGDRFMPQERQWMAAVAIATLPGASLWYDQQLEGRWGRIPVQLAGPVTARSFYRRLLAATNRGAIRQGNWALCQVRQSASMVAWCWQKGDDRVLVVLNVSDDVSRWGEIEVPWTDLDGQDWMLRNLLTGEESPAQHARRGVFYVRPRRFGADLFELLANRSGNAR